MAILILTSSVGMDDESEFDWKKPYAPPRSMPVISPSSDGMVPVKLLRPQFCVDKM